MAPETPHPGDGGNWRPISNERWHWLNDEEKKTGGFAVHGVSAIWPPPTKEIE